MGQLRNECDYFNWPTGDEWRVSECDRLWFTDNENKYN